MSPQFVDFDGDGDDDIVGGIFDGSPHVSFWDNDREGYLQPVGILDKDGDRIVLNQWWNYSAKKWDQTDRCDPEAGVPAQGHLTSAIAFDFDRDGDYDLVLGDHDAGYVYLRRNEGTNRAPRFATRNELVFADGEPMRDPGTVATIRSVDWNWDGVPDLLVGGMGDSYGNGPGGSVTVFLNERRSGESEFGRGVTLIEPSRKLATSAPLRPDAGLHPDAVDFDRDGDLDLIVGGYSMWKPTQPDLSDAELRRAEELSEQLKELNEKVHALNACAAAAREGLEGEAAQKAFAAAYDKIRPEMAALTRTRAPMQQELERLRPRPQRVSFTWVYENLAK